MDQTEDLGTYLGFLIIHGRTSKSTYATIIDKVRKKLAGWRANSLSMAGRITLAQSAVMSIPNYPMQAFVFPIGVCEEIERLCRNFIWGSSSETRKLHLISWRKICQPKKIGGMGFKSLRIVNEADMAKSGWRLISQPRLLWVQILRDKYKCGSNRMPSVSSHYRESNLWKGITNAWKYVQAGLLWNIGNEEIHSFLTVADLTENGNCKIDSLQESLPTEIIFKLHAISPRADLEEDTPTWSGSANGEFQMKMMYEIIGNPKDQMLPLEMYSWQAPNQ
ncbi:hypothetical protein SESBI_02390 [Sesbania bispinosa]|nr:hypothetical protein SESBI_02390 [Sesbania bispinosa]